MATLEGGDGSAEVRATASDVGVEVVLRYRLDDHGVLVVESSLTNTSDDPDAPRRRRAAGRPAAAGACRRGARPHRALVSRTLAAAQPLADGTWLRTGRRGRTGHDATLLMVRRHGRVRVPLGRGVGRARRVERQPRAPRRATARGRRSARGGARRRRGARGRRAAPRGRARPMPRRRWCSCTRPTGLDGLTRSLVRHQRARARLPHRAAPARAQHVGGRLLRHRPRRTCSGSPTPRPRSGSSASSSTTGGSAPAATTTAGWVTGRSPPTCGPTGSVRWSTTSRAGPGVRPVVRARDGQPRLRRRPRPPRVGPGAGGGPTAAVPAPARARPREPRCVHLRARGDERRHRRVRRRLREVGPQPRPARGGAH